MEIAPLADVTLERDGDRWTLVFPRDLPHPPDVVWRALTDPATLPEWAPFTADRDLGATGTATLTTTDGSDAPDLPAEVTVADVPRTLQYTWGDDLLRWEVGEGRLTLRHTVDERETAYDVAAGWHLCLDVAEHLLAGDPVEPIVGTKALDHGWQELRDGYAARLTPS